jgi:hypothetical protein
VDNSVENCAEVTKYPRQALLDSVISSSCHVRE